MSEEVTTTEWHSAFSYDNNQTRYDSRFPYTYKVALCVDGVYYDCSSNMRPELNDDTIRFHGVTDVCVYNASTGFWEDYSEALRTASIDDIVAQNLDSDMNNYYSSDTFDSGHIPVPMGTYFDSIYLVDALGGIEAVLPVVLVVILGFLAVRKGISFVKGSVKGG